MRRALLAATLLVPLHACTTESEGGDTDTDAGSSSSGSTSGSPTGSPTTDVSSSSTTDSVESSSSSTGPDGASSSSGGADESSTGEPPGDICFGYSLLGMTGEVATDGTAMGEPMCSTMPAACQGDVVGTWTVEDACGYEVLPNFFEEICAGATQQITGSTASGTRTYAEDGTYAFDLMIQLEADLQVDSMECIGVDCETFGEALSKEPGLEMVCADGAGSSCDCLYTVDLPTQDTGTWDIFEDALLLTSDSGETLGLFEYCVADGRMTTWLPLFNETPFPDTRCTNDGDCEGQVDGDFDAIGCDTPDDEER